MGVIATSALELGIDVGGLDVCILVGYPGSVMSAWQRVGRVGRQGRESLVVLVAQPDALDQYFMTHPSEFFERGFEPAVVDPTNFTVAGAHLVCAGAELPVPRAEAERYIGGGGLATLLEEGRLAQDEHGERFFSLKRRPHQEVNLRSGASRGRSSPTTGTGRSGRSTGCGSSTSATKGPSTCTPATATGSSGWTARRSACSRCPSRAITTRRRSAARKPRSSRRCAGPTAGASGCSSGA